AGGHREDGLAGEVVADLGEGGRVDQGQVVQCEGRVETGGLVEDLAGGGADGRRSAGGGRDGVRVGGRAGLPYGAEGLGPRARGGHRAGTRAQCLLGRVPVPARGQGLGEGERGAPLGGREVAVAAGQGEPVLLADRGDADDLDVEVQVPHHAADEGELLGVLLAVEGEVGAGEVEQLGDDGEHAVEVA